MKRAVASLFMLFVLPALAEAAAPPVPPPAHSRHARPPLLADDSPGPNIPCYGCLDDAPLFESPSSGFWSDPGKAGTGFMFSIQAGMLRGKYYGYDGQGHPLWYQFSGALQRPEGAPNVWRVTAPLERYGDGTCIGCAYQPPQRLPDAGTITIDFDQANYASYSINGGARKYAVPMVEGISSVRYFPDYEDYDFPDLSGGAWTLVLVDPMGRRSSWVGQFAEWSVIEGVRIAVIFAETYGIDELIPISDFQCGLVLLSPPIQSDYPICFYSFDKFSSYYDPDVDPSSEDRYIEFPIPLANIGASRIVSVDPATGIRLELFRLGYD